MLGGGLMTHQVSVLIENKPGRLKQISEILSKNNINIKALSISDSGIYGVVKLLLNKPQKGCAILLDEGITASLKDIIAVESENVPGGIFGVADLLGQENINIEDAYGFGINKKNRAVFIFQVNEPEKTKKMFKEHGYKILSKKELNLL